LRALGWNPATYPKAFATMLENWQAESRAPRTPQDVSELSSHLEHSALVAHSAFQFLSQMKVLGFSKGDAEHVQRIG
jgi:hypothetical protein